MANGNQWTKEMEMRLTDTDVVLLDGETQVLKEVRFNSIPHCNLEWCDFEFLCSKVYC